MSDYQQYFVKAKTAKKALVNLGEETTNKILLAIATQAVQQTAYLLQENAKDLAKMSADDPKHDRLLLNEERIAAIAADIRNVVLLKTPLGTVLSSQVMPNEMQIKKVRVPLGVVGVIYEARPNVTFDVFSLAFKTGNVIILKGGSDAEHSNAAIVGLIQAVLDAHQLDPAIVTLLPAERESTDALLQATGFVDVLIPRGSQGLINFVRENSKVPVIETGAGIVHIYGDESAAIDRLRNIVFNAKTRRPSVCNSLDCLIVHQTLLTSLPEVVKPLASKEVVIFADHKAYEALLSRYPDNLLHPAEDMHYGTEFLSLKMSIKTVNSMNEALSHIEQYSSKHSEAIVSEDEEQIAYFLNHVDAAAIYANVSTAFTDGAQFGLGAEIGISTQKLHARGPMGLEELTSYKWIVEGKGQIRN